MRLGLLGAADYLIGAVELGVVVLAAGAAAVRVRGRLLPGWSGPPAWLADAVLAVALVIWVAELLGSFDALRELVLVIAVVLAALAVWRFVAPAERGPAGSGPPLPPAPPAGAVATAAALLAAGLVVAHWSIEVRLVLDQGITNFDSTWYHGPFAAGFAQGHSTFDLQLIAPQFLAWFYPQNSELLHGIGILAFGRDSLSPLLNVGWLAGTLLAAWCIGRPYGVGPLSLIGAAIVLDSGVLADQAGSMRNDMPAIFFLLAAGAVAVNARSLESQRRGLPFGALAIAGLAAGLAAGVKLNYLLPAIGLAAGLVAAAEPGLRRRAAVAVGAPLLAGCGYWFGRNLIQAGNPLPWVKSLGPVSLPGPDQALGGRRQDSVLGYLFDGETWSDWFLPGLHDSLGFLWPIVLAAAAIGLFVSLRRRDAVVRALGLAGLLALVAWVVAPASAAGPSGMPLSFESGLRYLAPALIIGFALLPIALAADRERLRFGLLAALLVCLAFADASGGPWYGGYVAGALAVGALAAAAIGGLGSRRATGLPRPLKPAAVAALLALALVAGWVEQRRYLDHRYADPRFAAPGLNRAFGWARELSGRRIATTATRQYPLWGTDLSNWVRFAGVSRSQGGFVRASSCRRWRRLLNAGDYDYVVASLDRVQPGGRRYPPEAGWTEGEGATELLRVAPTVVFRLDGPLPVSRCP